MLLLSPVLNNHKVFTQASSQRLTATATIGDSAFSSVIVDSGGGVGTVMSRFTSASTTVVGCPASTCLAALSVAISIASLLLSFQTWRRRCEWEEQEQSEKKDPIRHEDLTTAVAVAGRNPDQFSANQKSCIESGPSVSYYNRALHKPSDDIAAENTTPDPNRVRATFENQILANITGKELSVRPIGVVKSIYSLCVGTPRQGLLAPHSRGRIELSGLTFGLAKDSVMELERFSHIWIVFVFHLNTLSKNNQKWASPKIAPPALGGAKVGVLATRSPHRFNPIGITLAKLDHVELKDKSQAKGGSRVVLHISGLDLVDGTPVLDVKPFVPVYDSVSPAQAQAYTDSATAMHNGIEDASGVRLPPWVSEGLATRRSVTISNAAKDDLRHILQSSSSANPSTNRPPLTFYGVRNGDRSIEEASDNILACIEEVLAMDVRSSWQTKKARQGRVRAQRAHRVKGKAQDNNDDAATKEILPFIPPSSSCTQQLDNLLLHFTVTEASKVQRATSEGSGAEDKVFVDSIEHWV